MSYQENKLEAEDFVESKEEESVIDFPWFVDTAWILDGCKERKKRAVKEDVEEMKDVLQQG